MKVDLLSDAYLKFVRLMEALENNPQLPKLDHLEMKLLQQVALQNNIGKTPLVGDLIFASDIGSPATLHRRIAKLIDQDLLRYKADIDGRKRLLELTPKSRDYCSRLGKCVVTAAQAV